ncbi:pancreatic progenitor cell differentiation and proliferation factor [Microtus pennsylvanicus]|uniref:pancreatic progenitor cell differentiation and proliferation factor n=1 Tax=Microtus pennsylvanicus TaxID=10058 RepID=UPI003F6D6E06
MAAIPSSGSLVATHDYYRRRLGSWSSISACGSPGYPWDTLLHPPGLPKANPGHWWGSFYYGISTLPLMTTVLLESPEHPAESPQASRSPITRGLAPETLKQQPVVHPGQANRRTPS